MEAPTRLSEDGRYVVGNEVYAPTSSRVATRLDLETGIPEFLTTTPSRAYDISDDGTVVLGASSGSGSNRPFLWTEQGGVHFLPVPPHGSTDAGWMQLSGDGTTVAVAYVVLSSHVGYRWNLTTGFEPLGSLGGPQSIYIDDISYDGSAIVGSEEALDGFRKAFRWTPQLGMVSLGTLFAYGTGASRAYGVSADGTVIVGHTSAPGGTVPFIWRPTTGMRRAFPMLDPASGGTLLAVTADGRRFGGNFWDQAGQGTLLLAEGEPPVTIDTPFGNSSTSLPHIVDLAANGTVALVRNTLWPNYSAVVRLSAIGLSACANAAANSTGCVGRVFASGSSAAAANDLQLRATSLPAQVFGMFLVGSAFARDASPTINGGALCSGGVLGRFNGPGQIASTGVTGELFIDVDLTALPHGATSVAVHAGESWTFQAWHRDTAPGASSSQLTDAVVITFR